MRRRFLAAVLISSISILPVGHGFADNSVYLEIGNDTTDSEAEKNWQQLTLKYETLLHGLNFYPKHIYQNGLKIATRIQAGPVPTKDNAHKICKQLFADDVACFVIEDLSIAPPAAIISLPEKVQEQQQLRQIEPPPSVFSKPEAPRSSNESGNFDIGGRILSWLDMDDTNSTESVTRDETPLHADIAARTLEPLTPVEQNAPSEIQASSAAQPESSKKAKVEVAEAIRVPLSETREMKPLKDQPELQTNLTRSTSSTPAATAPSAAVSAIIASAGWLNVASFRDETHASSTWQKVRRTIPERAAGLRVRIVRPFIVKDTANTSLTVGPFASSNDAISFCNDGVKQVDSSLQCQFSSEEPQGVAQPIVPRFNQHADGYQERRMLQAARYNAALSPAAGKGRYSGKIYWLEVVSAASQMEALNAWEDLRTAHADLLGKKRSNISSSLNKPGLYTVRVGPMTENAEAATLCSDLKTRQISCTLVQSSQ